MPRLLKISSWVLATALVVVIFAFVGVVSFLDTNTPKRERYLIPEGYAGWLCVTYSVTGAPPLEMEDGFNLVKFSTSGIVETSTTGKPGKYKDEYWFYTGNTRRALNAEKELGGGYTVAQVDAKGRYTAMFWVSSNAKEDQRPYSSNKENKCGPFK